MTVLQDPTEKRGGGVHSPRSGAQQPLAPARARLPLLALVVCPRALRRVGLLCLLCAWQVVGHRGPAEHVGGVQRAGRVGGRGQRAGRVGGSCVAAYA